MDTAIMEEKSIQNYNEISEEGSTTLAVETVSCCEGIDVDVEEYNQKLYDRVSTLRKTIHNLRKELKKEREIWKHELENKKKFDYYSQLSNHGYDIRGYQENLFTNFENRKHIENQIEAANYKRRLLEVENMCQMELMKVKQSVQILQPLQIMMSEWKFENESGDSLRPSEVLIDNTLETRELLIEADMHLEGTDSLDNALEGKDNSSNNTILENNKLGNHIKQSRSQHEIKKNVDV